METYYTPEGIVVIETDQGSILMTREEAEGLFVTLGHTLQDMDISVYSQENGETEQQPTHGG